jgi:hypothetical protein
MHSGVLSILLTPLLGVAGAEAPAQTAPSMDVAAIDAHLRAQMATHRLPGDSESSAPPTSLQSVRCCPRSGMWNARAEQVDPPLRLGPAAPQGEAPARRRGYVGRPTGSRRLVVASMTNESGDEPRHRVEACDALR